MAALGLLALMVCAQQAQAQAQAQAPDARMSARIAALEAELARVTSTLDLVTGARRSSEPAPGRSPTRNAVVAPAGQTNAAQPSAGGSGGLQDPIDRFTLAALNLQAVLLAGRPYQRELQAMRNLAPPDSLPSSLAETLLSHAGRGLATPADLRESFVALAPLLTARSPEYVGWGDWLKAIWGRLLAWIGLAEAVQPPGSEATVANVIQLLSRGRVSAALADLETLDPALQPLVVGWRAQARARVAAEQAVQETILRALGRGNPG